MKTHIVIIIIFSAISSMAQDVVHLKSGKSVAGKIVQTTDDTVLIRTMLKTDSAIYSYNKKDIAYLERNGGQYESFEPPVVKTEEPAIYPPVKFSGPRIGFTVIGPGALANRIRNEMDKVPFITQFGWQLETRMFTFANGTSGLAEFVPLIGGIEQGMFLPSINFLFGLRSKTGFEFAFGPNLSISGPAMVIAVGASIKRNDVYFPITLAIVPSVRMNESDVWSGDPVMVPSGTRIGLTIGFNSRKL